jgi:DNA-binding response OmpR family regulator
VTGAGGDAPRARPEVLVVEDDPEIAALLELVLVDEGLRVRLARNGEEGLARMSEGLPDLVVTDLEMPLLSGDRMAARMIIEDCGREKLPIVVLSGIEGLDSVVRAIGTPYYLAKPFHVDALRALVARALRERTPPSPAP